MKNISRDDNCCEGAKHENLRVCEVNHSQDSIDHGVAKRDKHIDEAQSDS